MRILYIGPSKDASYQVSIHLAKRFFRKDDFLEINQSETRIAFGSHVCQQIGTKLAIFIKDFPRMLPTISFDSFGQAVSEETIFLEINQSETSITCGGHVC